MIYLVKFLFLKPRGSDEASKRNSCQSGKTGGEVSAPLSIGSFGSDLWFFRWES
jgi:hypothetical protein